MTFIFYFYHKNLSTLIIVKRFCPWRSLITEVSLSLMRISQYCLQHRHKIILFIYHTYLVKTLHNKISGHISETSTFCSHHWLRVQSTTVFCIIVYTKFKEFSIGVTRGTLGVIAPKNSRKADHQKPGL